MHNKKITNASSIKGWDGAGLPTVFMVFLLLLVATVRPAAQENDSDAKTVTIMAVNDMHSAIDMFPQLAGIVDSVRAIHPDMLLFSAGDNRTGNPVNDRYKIPGFPIVDLMNRTGFNGSAVGNHEFDSKTDGFRTLIELSEFRYICGNIETHDSLRIHTLPYRFFERNGVHIGVLGLIQTGPNGLPDTHPDNVVGVSFTPPMDAVKNYMWMREQCDVFILLTHLGYEDDLLLAEICPEVDFIIGAHSHTVVPNRVLRNGILISQTGRALKYVSELKIEVSGGKVTGNEHKLIDIKATSLRNKEIQDAVDLYNNNDMLKEVLTNVTTPFETPDELGYLMADAQCAETNSDIAIMNFGGVRYDTHATGDFTMNDAFMLDPFDNALYTFEMTGQDVEDLIISAYSIGEDPYVSGIKYSISRNADKSVKKLSVLLPNGKPIDKKKTYTVAINSYLAAVCPFTASRPYNDPNLGATAALINFLKKQPSISYQGEKRITIDN